MSVGARAEEGTDAGGEGHGEGAPEDYASRTDQRTRTAGARSEPPESSQAEQRRTSHGWYEPSLRREQHDYQGEYRTDGERKCRSKGRLHGTSSQGGGDA